ncbi:MAG: hypothetical protein ABJA83_14705, partial [Burkholderiaceae bacterium]
DLRAYYTKMCREAVGALPNLHKDAAATARIYDRRKTCHRVSLFFRYVGYVGGPHHPEIKRVELSSIFAEPRYLRAAK